MEYGVLGANFNITSLGNKQSAELPLKFALIALFSYVRSIEPDFRLRSDYTPH